VISTTLLIIVVVIIVLLLALGAIQLFMRRSRQRRREEQRERTREEFGEEYERTIEERGSEEEAEKELRQRRGRVERQIQPLSDEGRQRYEERMHEAERIFVDNPERSIELADRAVSDLLEERNLISDAAQDDRETERSLAAAYPEIAEDYREARRARVEVIARSGGSTGEGSNKETTEELRQVVRKYRSVYERLARD
jgi:hypothetical protein